MREMKKWMINKERKQKERGGSKMIRYLKRQIDK